MIKMMVTVVIVFTICWLPFNILSVSIAHLFENMIAYAMVAMVQLQLLLNDEQFSLWEPLPYVWIAFHWLAMSHSCYNPIIYCYMNARFRGGFLQIIYRVPGLRRRCCLRRYMRTRNERSFAGTGEMNSQFNGGELLRKPKIRIRCHHLPLLLVIIFFI